MVYFVIPIGIISIISVASVSAQNRTNNLNYTSSGKPNNNTQNFRENVSSSIPINTVINEALQSKVNITLNDALSIALNSTGPNSKAIFASIGQKNGYLIYDIKTLDSNQTINRLIIDPGNGKILINKYMVPKVNKNFLNNNFGKSFIYNHGGEFNCRGQAHGFGSGMHNQWNNLDNRYRNSFFSKHNSHSIMT